MKSSVSRGAMWLASAALLIYMSPLPVWSTAQASLLQQGPAIDPVVRASAQQAATVVASALRPAAVLDVASQPALQGARGELTAQPSETPTEESVEEATAEAVAAPTQEPTEEPTEESAVASLLPLPTPTPQPVPIETPEVTPEAAPSTIAAVDYMTVAKSQYSNQGIALQAPADWSVTTEGFGALFNITVPNSEFVAIVQDSGDEFPGVLGVVIFRTMAETLVKEFDESAELIGVEMLQTAQQLPVTKIEFTGPIEGVQASGAFYVVSPGDSAYLLIVFAPSADWDMVEPGVDLIAQSIFFDAFLITLTVAESGDLAYQDEAGTLEILLPQNWQVTETNSEDVPVLVVDPNFNFGAALFSDSGSSSLADIQALVGTDGGSFDDELAEQFVLALMASLELGDTSDLVLDSDVTDVVIESEQLLVRLGGLLQSSDGFEMPMIFYVQADLAGLVAIVCFGDVAEVLNQDAVLRESVTSAVLLQ